MTRRSFPRQAFPRDDEQGYVSARERQRAETYPCASSRGNASRGKDRRVMLVCNSVLELNSNPLQGHTAGKAQFPTLSLNHQTTGP